MSRIKAIKQSKLRKNRDECVLPVSPENTARHPQVLHPQNPPSGNGSKKEVLVNTPTLTWAYTMTFKEKGNDAIKLDAANLNRKFEKRITKKKKSSRLEGY